MAFCRKTTFMSNYHLSDKGMNLTAKLCFNSCYSQVEKVMGCQLKWKKPVLLYLFRAISECPGNIHILPFLLKNETYVENIDCIHIIYANRWIGNLRCAAYHKGNWNSWCLYETNYRKKLTGRRQTSCLSTSTAKELSQGVEPSTSGNKSSWLPKQDLTTLPPWSQKPSTIILKRMTRLLNCKKNNWHNIITIIIIPLFVVVVVVAPLSKRTPTTEAFKFTQWMEQLIKQNPIEQLINTHIFLPHYTKARSQPNQWSLLLP